MATTGFQIEIKYVIYLLSAFVHPGQPVYVFLCILLAFWLGLIYFLKHSAVMYANLYGNSSAYQTMRMLQDLKLGQYTKLPPRATFLAQMSGSIIGSIFNYTSTSFLFARN